MTYFEDQYNYALLVFRDSEHGGADNALLEIIESLAGRVTQLEKKGHRSCGAEGCEDGFIYADDSDDYGNDLYKKCEDCNG